MSTLDLDHLRQWIGRSETVSDQIAPEFVRRLRATLDQTPGEPRPGEATPLGAHWCLAPAVVPISETGPDGHPRRGSFMPPVPLPRRMWAGSTVDFLDPLRVGDAVDRRTTIVEVTAKEGRSGSLCFVTVENLFITPRGPAVRERQTTVYRALAAAVASAAPLVPMMAPTPTWQRQLRSDPVLLFRYSAVTFNSHRIHYDRLYATGEEGYPSLVFHGPLQATLLLHFATSLRQGSVPSRCEIRGVHPLFEGTAFSLNACEADPGLSLWVADADGRQTMTVAAIFNA